MDLWVHKEYSVSFGNIRWKKHIIKKVSNQANEHLEFLFLLPTI